MKNLMTVLPYDDPTIVLELDANALWDTMESGLSRWPVQEGCVISLYLSGHPSNYITQPFPCYIRHESDMG